MAQNEPQRTETPPGPSTNSTSLLFEYQCRSGKFIRLANRIEKIDSVARIESKLFCPNWNALFSTGNGPGKPALCQLYRHTFVHSGAGKAAAKTYISLSATLGPSTKSRFSHGWVVLDRGPVDGMLLTIVHYW